MTIKYNMLPISLVGYYLIEVFFSLCLLDITCYDLNVKFSIEAHAFKAWASVYDTILKAIGLAGEVGHLG